MDIDNTGVKSMAYDGVAMRHVRYHFVEGKATDGLINLQLTSRAAFALKDITTVPNLSYIEFPLKSSKLISCSTKSAAWTQMI